MFETQSKTPNAWRVRNEAVPLPRPWRWPLDQLGDHDPIVLGEYQHDDRRGVDLGYEVQPIDAKLYVPVRASQDGFVMFAGATRSGFVASLDHGALVTYYGHLSMVLVGTDHKHRVGERHHVRAGDVIGYAARSPVHVRFELWHRGADGRLVALDPVAAITSWMGPRQQRAA